MPSLQLTQNNWNKKGLVFFCFIIFRHLSALNSQTREQIKAVTKDIDVLVRALQSSVAGLHTSTTSDAIAATVALIDSQLGALSATWPRLNSVVGAGQFYRYKGMWQNAIRDAVSIAVLRHWLVGNQLLSLESAAARLGVVAAALGETSDAVSLELEDFLFAVACVPSELARLSVNAVTHGNLELPVRIGAFVSSLFAAFRLLNLKNDFLRKRYDSIKYDQAKCEGVLYDLSVRNLVPTTAPPATTITLPQ
jgi:hypothetical protein